MRDNVIIIIIVDIIIIIIINNNTKNVALNGANQIQSRLLLKIILYFFFQEIEHVWGFLLTACYWSVNWLHTDWPLPACFYFIRVFHRGKRHSSPWSFTDL